MASTKGRVQSVEFYEPIFFRGLRRRSAIRGDGFMALPLDTAICNFKSLPSQIMGSAWRRVHCLIRRVSIRRL